MPISKTQIILSEFLLYFLNLNQFLKNLKKKKKFSGLLYFANHGVQQLFDSQHDKPPKHCFNLYDRSIIIFFITVVEIVLENVSVSKICEIYRMFLHTLTVKTSIFLVTVKNCCNQFKYNYLVSDIFIKF